MRGACVQGLEAPGETLKGACRGHRLLELFRAGKQSSAGGDEMPGGNAVPPPCQGPSNPLLPGRNQLRGQAWTEGPGQHPAGLRGGPFAPPAQLSSGAVPRFRHGPETRTAPWPGACVLPFFSSSPVGGGVSGTKTQRCETFAPPPSWEAGSPLVRLRELGVPGAQRPPRCSVVPDEEPFRARR